MTAPTASNDCVSAAALTGRGWTPAAIRRFLGEPDHTAPNPFYRQAAPMRLYSLTRAVAAEDTPQWRQWRTEADQRSTRAKAAAERKRNTLVAEINAVPIRVPDLDLGRLAELAVAHRNRVNADRAYERGFDPTPATVTGVDTATLHRWMVNYLRHARTRYDTVLDGLYARVGCAIAADVIRDRVLDAIASAYPTLAAEARRQAAER